MTNLERLEKDIREKIPRLAFRTEYKAMLNDVLECLNDHCVGSNGSFRKRVNFNEFTQLYSKSKRTLHWNFSEPYLKDQSQELIDYLASLI